MGTRYYKGIDGTFTDTLLKKYRRYWYSVPILSTFQRENFAHFGSNIIRDFMDSTIIGSLICVVVTGITCSLLSE